LIEAPDIFRAAKLLIDQHGEDAPLRAAQRADELLKDGDIDGSAVWGRILAAINELRRGRLEGEALNLGRERPTRAAPAPSGRRGEFPVRILHPRTPVPLAYISG
jgi:hypothetical protein